MLNITNRLWDYVEAKRNTKQGERVYQWLNKDNLAEVIIDNGVFWWEINGRSYGNTMPDYIYDYLKKWGKQQGYTYLYDIKQT